MSEKDKWAIFGKRSVQKSVDKNDEEGTQKDEVGGFYYNSALVRQFNFQASFILSNH